MNFSFVNCQSNVLTINCIYRFAFFPIHIGDYVYIEDDCVINAASIGNFVHIGKGAVIVFKLEL